mmetsp:Transcript_79116/g.228812  ORF Transcript_79116/g.228812 Transcript_79116/m.228812 type:complete len:209 (+) Transcript_79116:446-1072(+)
MHRRGHAAPDLGRGLGPELFVAGLRRLPGGPREALARAGIPSGGQTSRRRSEHVARCRLCGHQHQGPEELDRCFSGAGQLQRVALAQRLGGLVRDGWAWPRRPLAGDESRADGAVLLGGQQLFNDVEAWRSGGCADPRVRQGAGRLEVPFAVRARRSAGLGLHSRLRPLEGVVAARLGRNLRRLPSRAFRARPRRFGADRGSQAQRAR